MESQGVVKPEERKALLSFERIKKARLETSFGSFPAWRILHSNDLGPGKGGIRFHPGVSENEVKALAFWMSIKTSLLGLPFGGAKGGVKFNPKDFDEKQLEEISRAYAKAFAKFWGQKKDIPAPDVSTNAQTMAWILDEFEKIAKRKEPGMVTGKPLELGGIKIRDGATAKGAMIVLREFMKNSKMKPKQTTVAVQGTGNAGRHFAGLCSEKGFKAVALSDSKGAAFNKKGLDVEKAAQAKKQTGRVKDLENAEKISNEELLGLEVDVLALAALDNAITKENASKVKAKIVIELANGPIASDAEETVLKKGVRVLPDVLANAGGVTASYLEWAQNRSGNFFEEERLEKKFREKMVAAFEKVYRSAEENKTDYRNAAYRIAIARILEAKKARSSL